MFLTPEYLFADITHITPEFLREKGITALVLDVDNTLTGHNSQALEPSVEQWLRQMRENGIHLTILSNNSAQRVSPFAQAIGLEWVSFACKPLTFGLHRAQKRLKIPRRQMAMVGDQLFTDRLAAAWFGIRAFVVLPRSADFKKGILFKRRLEKPFLRKYYRRGGKLL